MPAAVPVDRVAALCNPLLDWPWACEVPASADLACLLANATEVDQPVETTAAAEIHAGRIRYLARVGWSDAIELDLGCPVLGYPGPDWPCTDGNHRLAAAILRGDTEILVDVAGQVCHAAALLGISESIIIGEREAADCTA